MIGDHVRPEPHHTGAAEALLRLLGHRLEDGAVMTIAGESGSGKSEIAFECSRLFGAAGIPVFVFQQDDYFRYPPMTNAERRRKDIGWVGPQEVALDLLDTHLDHFRTRRKTPLTKPVVVFHENRATTEVIDVTAFRLGIAEGTYTTTLHNVDYRVFIDRAYRDTLKHRQKRSRDEIDAFSENILEIEHGIISQHKSRADIIVNGNYSLTVVRNDLRLPKGEE